MVVLIDTSRTVKGSNHGRELLLPTHSSFLDKAISRSLADDAPFHGLIRGMHLLELELQLFHSLKKFEFLYPSKIQLLESINVEALEDINLTFQGIYFVYTAFYIL